MGRHAGAPSGGPAPPRHALPQHVLLSCVARTEVTCSCRAGYMLNFAWHVLPQPVCTHTVQHGGIGRVYPVYYCRASDITLFFFMSKGIILADTWFNYEPQCTRFVPVWHAVILSVQGVIVRFPSPPAPPPNPHAVFLCNCMHSTPENPPVLLKCGHAVLRSSVSRLARNGSKFKCPTCPVEQVESETMALTL